MRKFRCPHCGEKTISYFDRFCGKFTGGYHKGIYSYDRLSCKACGAQCTARSSSTIVFIICLLILALVIIGLVTYLLGNTKISLRMLVAAAVLGIIPFTASVFVNPLIGINPDGKTTPSGSVDYKSPNAKVSVNSNRGIRSYWIYGVKFEGNTENAKFHERFKDGLVPVVFHEKRKGSNAFEVRIIDKEFVPEELLHVGSEFLVEDNNQFICRGKVTGIFEVDK